MESQDDTLSKSNSKLCEECDTETAIKFCQACEQNLCLKCDTKIHNKGKRALHERVPIIKTTKKYLLDLQSCDRQNLASEKIFYSDTLLVTYAQPLQIEADNRELQIMIRCVLNYHLNRAQEGNLMFELSEFKTQIFQLVSQELKSLSRQEFNYLFNQIKEIGQIHYTTRKFGDSKPIKYVSLLFKSLSVESIIWQLKSIRNDRMKPTEKLMLSRIKEYFALKINLKDWSSFIDLLRLNPDEVNKHDGIQPKISIAASLEDNNLDNSYVNRQNMQNLKKNEILNQTLSSNNDYLWNTSRLDDTFNDSESFINPEKNFEGSDIFVQNDLKCFSENLSTNLTKLSTNNAHKKSEKNHVLSDVSSNLKHDANSNTEKISQNYYFVIEGISWIYEDIITLNFDKYKKGVDMDNYNIFKKFVDAFFNEPTTSGSPNSEDSRSKLKKKKNAKNIQKWLSSVENVHTKPANSLSINYSLQKIMNDQSISRAIPGGKYGCAQMIKLIGPPEQNHLSLGKLCAFVQEAQNENLLIYYKTLLIKNNQFNSYNEKSQNQNSKKSNLILNECRELILKILEQHKNGISLAQIPIFMRKTYGKTYNFQALGFPKLKNLLASMDEVEQEKMSGNSLKAQLKNMPNRTQVSNVSTNQTVNSNNLENNSENKTLINQMIANDQLQYKRKRTQDKKFFSLQGKACDVRFSNHIENDLFEAQNNNQNTTKNANFFDQGNFRIVNNQKSARTCSNLNDYYNKVEMIILEILYMNPNGLKSEVLYDFLNARLQSEMHPWMFSADNFQDFLATYMNEYLHIIVEKAPLEQMMGSSENRPSYSYFIMLKNNKLTGHEFKHHQPKDVNILNQQESNSSAMLFSKLGNESFFSQNTSFNNQFNSMLNCMSIQNNNNQENYGNKNNQENYGNRMSLANERNNHENNSFSNHNKSFFNNSNENHNINLNASEMMMHSNSKQKVFYCQGNSPEESNIDHKILNKNKISGLQNYNTKSTAINESDQLIAFNCNKFQDIEIEQNIVDNNKKRSTKNNGFEFQLITPKDILKSHDKLKPRHHKKRLIEYSPHNPSENSPISEFNNKEIHASIKFTEQLLE